MQVRWQQHTGSLPLASWDSRCHWSAHRVDLKAVSAHRIQPSTRSVISKLALNARYTCCIQIACYPSVLALQASPRQKSESRGPYFFQTEKAAEASSLCPQEPSWWWIGALNPAGPGRSVLEGLAAQSPGRGFQGKQWQAWGRSGHLNQALGVNEQFQEKHCHWVWNAQDFPWRGSNNAGSKCNCILLNWKQEEKFMRSSGFSQHLFAAIYSCLCHISIVWFSFAESICALDLFFSRNMKPLWQSTVSRALKVALTMALVALQELAESVREGLGGTSIYLVGMMGRSVLQLFCLLWRIECKVKHTLLSPNMEASNASNILNCPTYNFGNCSPLSNVKSLWLNTTEYSMCSS